MTIHTAIATPAATPATPANTATSDRLQRQDGWTADAQRSFLEAIAEGHPVDAACRRVGLSHQSAYAFRRRAAGASFALGWQAAALIARNRIADELVSRALDGQVDTITRADGSIVTRHRFDNRLAMSMLTRLDRLADAQAAEGTHHAARLIAQEFEAFLDVISADDGPARAGLFLGLRVGGGTDRDAADIAPVIALARADRWCRTGAALQDDLRIDDLDPAKRAHWSAEQWARAEAAGLLTLAPPPAPSAADAAADPAGSGDATDRDCNPQLMQPRPGRHDDEPVWFDEQHQQMMTSFPPPPGFNGYEGSDFGDDDYCRYLTDEEQAVLDVIEQERVAPLRAQGTAERDAWFGFAPHDAGDDAGDAPGDGGTGREEAGFDDFQAIEACEDDTDDDRERDAGFGSSGTPIRKRGKRVGAGPAGTAAAK